jgi:hypothetical protein
VKVPFGTPGGYLNLLGSNQQGSEIFRKALTIPEPLEFTGGRIAITGNPAVGSTLQAVVSGLNQTPEQVTYQWLRNGLEIASATGTSYRTGFADSGATIAVRATITAIGFNPAELLSASVTVAVPAPAVQPVLRVYNSITRVHLWTANRTEYDLLTAPGSPWRAEGVAWFAPVTGVPVNRLFNPRTNRHLYTSNAAEISALIQEGWLNEGTAFFSSPAGGVAVTRLFHPGMNTHLLSRDPSEIAGLVASGWNNEGTAFYAAR